MMNSTHEVHSWSKLYREEALQGAKTRHLERQLRTTRGHPVQLALLAALAAILLFASGCTDTASSSTSTSTRATDHEVSVAPSSDAARYAGMRPSGSWECYTFYSDGTVELRHGGTSAVSDSGSYQGDEQFGEIVWDSGKWTSTVVGEGDGLIVDELKVSLVASCF